MPRRDTLSTEKRKRLMQEHEQLQHLMLQARSSVRRSSLKEHAEKIPVEDATSADVFIPEEKSSAPIIVQEEVLPEIKTIKEKPRNKKNLVSTEPPQEKNEKRTLTETDLFQQPITTPVFEQAAAAMPAQPEIKHTAETVRNTTFVSEPVFEERTFVKAEPTGYDEPFQKRRSSKTRLPMLVLLSALVAGFGGVYFYAHTKNHGTAPAAKQNLPAIVTPAPETSTVPQTNTAKIQPPASNETNPPAVTATAKKELPKADKPKPVAATPPPAVKKVESPTANASVGKFKVIAKAYFHDTPDESTRRKAFMTHWDDAVLTPLDDKNGFIYITFTNHLGQTSKGWLRKSDLHRID